MVTTFKHAAMVIKAHVSVITSPWATLSPPRSNIAHFDVTHNLQQLMARCNIIFLTSTMTVSDYIWHFINRFICLDLYGTELSLIDLHPQQGLSTCSVCQNENIKMTRKKQTDKNQTFINYFSIVYLPKNNTDLDTAIFCFCYFFKYQLKKNILK